MRIEQLTFTRFIAAISIVIFHFGDHSVLFNNKYTAFIFNQANVGVSYFFILSGFVMIVAYSSYERIDYVSFLRNRLARIYPVYVAALLLFLLIAFLDNRYSEITLSEVILHLFMLQTWFSSKVLSLNYPGWSLSVELFFYLIFPFFFNFFYRKKNIQSIGICIVLFWVITQLIFHLIIQFDVIRVHEVNKNYFKYNPLMHLNEFLIGNLLGLYYVRKSVKKDKNYLNIIIVTLFVLVILLKFRFRLNFHNGLLAVVFVPLILFISISNDSIVTFFSKPFFIFLGEISFGLYILQVPIWSLLSDYRMNRYLGLDYQKDFTISFFIRLLVLVFFSSLSYVYFETPLRNVIKKIGVKNF